MAEFVYKDHIPANARILVDYKARQKVRFAYPQKWTYKQALREWVSPAVFFWWWFIHLQVGLTLLLVWVAYIFGMQLYTEGLKLDVPLGVSLNRNTWIMLGIIVEFGVVPKIAVWWIGKNPEWLSMNFPRINAWVAKNTSESMRTTFHGVDVKAKKVIIPCFRNVFLEYKCYGDFGRSLRRVEIFEYPFNYFYRASRLAWFLPRSKAEKFKNETLFRAVFYFDWVPVDGRMDVHFQ